MTTELTKAQWASMQDREQKVVAFLCGHYPADISFEVEFAPATLTAYLAGLCFIETITFWGNITNTAALRLSLHARLRLLDMDRVFLVGPQVIIYPKECDGD